MGLSYVIAVVRVNALEAVEQALIKLGVGGMTVVKVRGLGKRLSAGRDWRARDWLMDEAKIEIVADEMKIEAITKTIIDAAHCGGPGDGIVTVLPVSKFYRIRTRAEALPEDA